MYLENEYIVAAFKVLANFTYKVTLPHLCFVENAHLCFVEKSDQGEFCSILPVFYNGLAEGDMETLNKHQMEWKQVAMVNQVLITDLVVKW